MSFNIDTFKTRFENLGLLQTNKFEMLITPPPFLGGRSINNNGVLTPTYQISDSFRFRVETARIPGMHLMFADNQRYGVGPTQKEPFSAQLTELPFSFIVDKYGDLWQFWHNWVNGIFKHSGSSNSQGAGPSNSVPSYKAKYKDDFSTNVQIFVYSNDGGLSLIINLLQAFPTAITEIPLSWAEISQPMRLSVSLSYSEYTVEGAGVS